MPRTRLSFSLLRKLGCGYGVLALLTVVMNLVGCGERGGVVPVTRKVAEAVEQTAASCQSCHAEVHAAWRDTDHALANRLVDANGDAEALASFHPPVDDATAEEVGMILGHKPLWQPLIRARDGRWQAHELAYDPVQKNWFNVFDDEQREPGEWGHWTGRGMNWNSQCAHCHMTGYEKGYHADDDSYHSKWVEQGVSCIQCHGPMPSGHGASQSRKSATMLFHRDRGRMMETCAPCHARNEPLTDNFQPGDHYADHYRVALPTAPGMFWPDGQQREEDFNWTSVLLSRMGHAGVTCMDCHDPHTTKTILPTDNNQLCLQCHAAPGRVLPGGIRTVAINPVAHSHHVEGSAGNSCIACHMPTTTYMQRAPRHDHGWLKPDPLLTKELGIPNACATCHADKSTEWAIATTNEWYGAKMDSRQRARARAVAAAQAGAVDVVPVLLKLIGDEEVPAWQATLLSLLTPYVAQPEVRVVGEAALTASDPLVRSAAVRLLAGQADASAKLRPLLRDPVRLVRLDAAWALSSELSTDSPERKELDSYLRLSNDQPMGRLRIGQDWVNRGLVVEGEKKMAEAEQWDRRSPGILAAHARVLIVLGRMAEAGTKLRRASDLIPEDFELAMQAALAFAEAGDLANAEAAFRQAVQRNPQFHRAWYNLGLLLAQQQRLPEAITALQRAEVLAPKAADYPYALATVLLREGDTVMAKAAARRTLDISPSHQGALHILRTIR